MKPPNPIDMTNNKKDFANIVHFCIFVLVTECRIFQSYKDIYPIELVRNATATYLVGFFYGKHWSNN